MFNNLVHFWQNAADPRHTLQGNSVSGSRSSVSVKSSTPQRKLLDDYALGAGRSSPSHSRTAEKSAPKLIDDAAVCRENTDESSIISLEIATKVNTCAAVRTISTAVTTTTTATSTIHTTSTTPTSAIATKSTKSDLYNCISERTSDSDANNLVLKRGIDIAPFPLEGDAESTARSTTMINVKGSYSLQNRSSVAELLVGFFEFYSNFDINVDCVDTNSGHLIKKRGVAASVRRSALCVLDPTNPSNNVARYDSNPSARG